VLVFVTSTMAQPAIAQGRSSEAGSSDPADQRVDALGSEPSPKGQWRIGAFLGAAA
jgi:hypothetical protein